MTTIVKAVRDIRTAGYEASAGDQLEMSDDGEAARLYEAGDVEVTEWPRQTAAGSYHEVLKRVDSLARLVDIQGKTLRSIEQRLAKKPESREK